MCIPRLTAALLSAACAFCLYGRASASDNTSITAVFGRAIAAFNADNESGWVATCSATTSIIDEVPPHSWQSCADWWNSYQSFAKTNHVTAGAVTIGRPSSLQITSNTAYVVWPATFNYRQSGKAQREAGIFTVAFTKTGSAWLMSGWSWTKR